MLVCILMLIINKGSIVLTVGTKNFICKNPHYNKIARHTVGLLRKTVFMLVHNKMEFTPMFFSFLFMRVMFPLPLIHRLRQQICDTLWFCTYLQLQCSTYPMHWEHLRQSEVVDCFSIFFVSRSECYPLTGMISVLFALCTAAPIT